MFCYKVSIEYKRLKDIFETTEFKEYFKNFEPFKRLIFYPKNRNVNESLCYVYSDKDIFPPNMRWIGRHLINSLTTQEEANKIVFDTNKYEHDGDLSVLGDLDPPKDYQLN